MRPARSAPENHQEAVPRRQEDLGFNEAGAFCAGKLARLERNKAHVLLASMRPARSAPENLIEEYSLDYSMMASMRPARSAPENGGAGVTLKARGDSFNEAGAFCAGKYPAFQAALSTCLPLQ